jgi:hypothetical protein
VTANGTEEGTTEDEIVMMIDGNLLEEMTEMLQLVKTESFVNMSQRTMHYLNQKRDQLVSIHYTFIPYISYLFALSRSAKSYFVFTTPSKLGPRCSGSAKRGRGGYG